ncbi:DinB family protein [Niabella ginsengisoli]|uniref:DinB family protein n=1 Tax=Niabella ginsengisoli TaxID=522298 RepID=A0ABS9SFW4_9BACT|nr:DinB family protein [Niabella ginsengisoli]MCH5597220.1 DinB family protein [Niabella ginsengisoli]
MKQEKEVWLRGKDVNGITAHLQPVGHALLQAEEEIIILLENLNAKYLWQTPAGCASPGFHLLHIAGVLDRLLTYAEEKKLTADQLDYLQQETHVQPVTKEELLSKCKIQINNTLERLKQFSTINLTDKRNVGRSALPSTVIGLCTHAAEHTMRHVGQLLVTVRILNHKN